MQRYPCAVPAKAGIQVALRKRRKEYAPGGHRLASLDANRIVELGCLRLANAFDLVSILKVSRRLRKSLLDIFLAALFQSNLAAPFTPI